MPGKLSLLSTNHQGRYAVTDNKGRVVCYMSLEEAERFGLAPE